MEKYTKLKGSRGISGSGSPKKFSPKKGKGTDPAGYMDSRPSNDDRNQSAK